MVAIAYLEHNNAGKNILYNYNGKWWYEDIYTNGYYGDVNMYPTNEDGELYDIPPKISFSKVFKFIAKENWNAHHSHGNQKP